MIEDGDDEEDSGQDHALLSMCEALGSQGALGDELVEPPVEEEGDPDSSHQSGPGQSGVACWQDEMELILVLGHQVAESPHCLQSKPGGNSTAYEEGDSLDEIRTRPRP